MTDVHRIWMVYAYHEDEGGGFIRQIAMRVSEADALTLATQCAVQFREYVTCLANWEEEHRALYLTDKPAFFAARDGVYQEREDLIDKRGCRLDWVANLETDAPRYFAVPVSEDPRDNGQLVAWSSESAVLSNSRARAVHLSRVPFVAICGADVPNQKTTKIVRSVNCSECRFRAAMRNDMPMDDESAISNPRGVE